VQSLPAHPLRPTLLLILAVTLARLLFLYFSPYELAADEAQYWDWSRRLELSYHTKGPGAAWTIFASTALLGTSEFAVRAPAAIAAAIMMLALALLAKRIAERDAETDTGNPSGRAALYAVLITLAIPAYHAAALLMTIDGPMLACWAVALLAAWNLSHPSEPRAQARGQHFSRSIIPAALLGLSLGIGFLFKYTILLAALGIAIYFILTRKSRTRSILPALLITTIAFAACIAPVLIWNAQRGWPTIAHLLGHLGLAGSDLPKSATTPHRPYSLLWTLEYLGVLLAMAGPIVIAMSIAVRASLPHNTDNSEGPKGRKSVAVGGASPPGGRAEPTENGPKAASPNGATLPTLKEQHGHKEAALLALCVSLPVLLTYLGVSFFTDVEGNWPIGAWVSLIPVTAAFAPRAIDDYRAKIRHWLALPPSQRTRQGFLRRKPETPFQLALHLGLGFGVVAAIGMMCLAPLSRAPVIGPLIPIGRITGARELAAAVDRLRQPLENETGKQPFIVGARYTHTALLAFYCKGRPAVFCAGSRLGDRRSAYDDFSDTDLTNPDLLSRPAILVDAGRAANPDRWNRALRFEQPPIEAARVPPKPDPGQPTPTQTAPTSPARAYLISTARGYAGVAP
jgi:hypothetical protein